MQTLQVQRQFSELSCYLRNIIPERTLHCRIKDSIIIIIVNTVQTSRRVSVKHKLISKITLNKRTDC